MMTITLMRRRGFTLMEMLVVIAITAILLTVLFIPLTKTLDMTTRANASIQGQDSVRHAMRMVSRELSNAMEIYEARPIRTWGYDQWDLTKKFGKPLTAAVPESYLVNNAVVVMRLPKHRYFCAREHDVTPRDLDLVFPPPRPYDNAVALDTCPRHPGEKVSFRPVQPLEPDERLVVYYVALRDPSMLDTRLNTARPANPYDAANSVAPVYENLMLFGQNFINGTNRHNTYVLFRVEFDPRDPNLANWNLPGGLPNPDFCYNTGTAPNGQPWWRNWRNASIAVMTNEVGDAVRWVPTGNKMVPHPLCTFSPSPFDEEVAQPNREAGSLGISGTISAAALPPVSYETTHGNWSGLASSGGLPIPDTLLVGPAAAVAIPGPRIQLYELNGVVHTPVFDSQSPAVALRGRLVGFDSTTGRVVTSFDRYDPAAANPLLREYFPAPLTPLLTIDLRDSATGDRGVDPANGNMPTGLATAFTKYGPRARVTAGTDVVLLADLNSNPSTSEPLRRAGWTGLGSGLDRFVAQGDLQPNEYSIDYATGVITLSDRSEAQPQWAAVQNGAQTLLVKYQMQTNSPTDIVRVSYSSREMATLRVGVVEFTRRASDVLPFEMTARVNVRNLKR